MPPVAAGRQAVLVELRQGALLPAGHRGEAPVVLPVHAAAALPRGPEGRLGPFVPRRIMFLYVQRCAEVFSFESGLRCITADVCNQILVLFLQHFSRSTRFAHVCIAPNSGCSQIFGDTNVSIC